MLTSIVILSLKSAENTTVVPTRATPKKHCSSVADIGLHVRITQRKTRMCKLHNDTNFYYQAQLHKSRISYWTGRIIDRPVGNVPLLMTFVVVVFFWLTASFQDVQRFLNHSIQQLLCSANCYLHQRIYSQAREKQVPFRLETAFLLWACCRPLEWTGSVCDRLSHCEFVQEWITANATKQDGLLHGLTGPPGPTGLTLFWRSSSGTGAAAPGKSPGKPTLWFLNAPN